VFIFKTIYKVKIIDLKKQIIQSELKSGNLRLKYFLFENYEVAKSLRCSNWLKIDNSQWGILMFNPLIHKVSKSPSRIDVH
jgi:hypothetical protein